ncbi:hypothetical protein T06_13410 [Trichinella sp. T6]|nr:hypothetical protein T06_13410 [Trichinella sp. T6]
MKIKQIRKKVRCISQKYLIFINFDLRNNSTARIYIYTLFFYAHVSVTNNLHDSDLYIYFNS